MLVWGSFHTTPLHCSSCWALTQKSLKPCGAKDGSISSARIMDSFFLDVWPGEHPINNTRKLWKDVPTHSGF